MRIRTVLAAAVLAAVAAFPLAGVASRSPADRPRLPRLREPGRGAVGAAVALRRPGSGSTPTTTGWPARTTSAWAAPDPARCCRAPARRPGAPAGPLDRDPPGVVVPPPERRPTRHRCARFPSTRSSWSRRRRGHRRRLGRAADPVPVVLLAGGLGAAVALRRSPAARSTLTRARLHDTPPGPAPGGGGRSVSPTVDRLLGARRPRWVRRCSPAAAAAHPAPVAGPPPPPRRGDRRPRPLAAARPVRIRIPAIEVDSALIGLGLQADGTLQVPADGSVAGWFTGAPTPGEHGPAVIAAHVDWNHAPGVFFRPARPRPGRRGGGRPGRRHHRAVRRARGGAVPEGRVPDRARLRRHRPRRPAPDHLRGSSTARPAATATTWSSTPASSGPRYAPGFRRSAPRMTRRLAHALSAMSLDHLLRRQGRRGHASPGRRAAAWRRRPSAAAGDGAWDGRTRASTSSAGTG